MANRKYRPTANGTFSGAGGMELGMLQAGVKVVSSLDIDKQATNCMKQNSHYFSHQILTADIKDMCAYSLPETDIEIGTYPCNRYSTIADIHGTRTGEDLYLHYFRMVALRQPEMFILENVPGMKKFPVVMEAMSKLPGYYIKIFCPLDASIWLPQKRERLILIGTKKPFTISAPKAPRQRKTIKDIVERNAHVEMPASSLARLNGAYRDLPIIVDPSNKDAIAPTCVAHYAKDKGTRLVMDKKARHGVRPFTIREYARLQGFPDDFHFDDKVSSYRLIGNAVAVDMGKWVGSQAMKYFN